MNTSNDFLRLNVGFIIHETVGYSRDFPIEIDSIRIPPELELRNLVGTVRVTRTAQGLLVQVKMIAGTPAECSRCLDEFLLPLTADYTDLYAFNLNSVTDSGLLVPETGKINLAPILREEMLLSVPISPICKADCKGLCPICGENLNSNTCHHDEQDIDPRLAGLSTLLD